MRPRAPAWRSHRHLVRPCPQALCRASALPFAPAPLTRIAGNAAMAAISASFPSPIAHRPLRIARTVRSSPAGTHKRSQQQQPRTLCTLPSALGTLHSAIRHSATRHWALLQLSTRPSATLRTVNLYSAAQHLASSTWHSALGNLPSSFFRGNSPLPNLMPPGRLLGLLSSPSTTRRAASRSFFLRPTIGHQRPTTGDQRQAH